MSKHSLLAFVGMFLAVIVMFFAMWLFTVLVVPQVMAGSVSYTIGTLIGFALLIAWGLHDYI